MKKILAPQNRKRVRTLIEFRGHLTSFENARTIGDEPAEAEARQSLNRGLTNARSIVLSAGIGTELAFRTVVANGRMDIFHNLFNMGDFGLSREVVFDALDQAIGNYEADFARSKWRAINPFYYFGLLMDLVGSIPFWLLSRFGVNRSRAEETWWGKVLKIVFDLATFAAAVIAIMQAFRLRPFD